MKAKFYVDVYPGMQVGDLMPQNCTTTVPMMKIGECRRYYFELDFPVKEDVDLGVAEHSEDPPPDALSDEVTISTSHVLQEKGEGK